VFERLVCVEACVCVGEIMVAVVVEVAGRSSWVGSYVTSGMSPVVGLAK